MKTLSTNELLKRLNNVDSITALEEYMDYTSKYHLQLTFPAYLEMHRKKAGITPAQLIESAHIQRNYGYQILNVTKNPGRNKVIALCLALKLPFDEVQRALTIAKEGILYPKNPRDSILIFCINKSLSVMESNELLDVRKEELLI